MASDKKQKELERAMKLVWGSLWSHTITFDARDMKSRGAFHRRCIKEYAYILKALADRL